MILTPDFVFLNNPRTGSTFARKAICAAYTATEESGGAVSTVQELLLPINRGRGQRGVDQHGTRAQIPKSARGLPIASGVRNPFTLLVAIFELGIWRDLLRPISSNIDLDDFPLGSFEYFLRLEALSTNWRWGVPIDTPGLGPLSIHYLQMFAREPRQALKRASSGASFEELEHFIDGITFLRQETLQEDLYRFMRAQGAAGSLEAILEHPPSHVTRRSREWSHASFPRRVVEQIAEREEFLFSSLARRGIFYNFQNAEFAQKQKPS